MSSDPATIYQEWLDCVSGPLLHGTVEILEKYISLPYLHRSVDNRTVIETRSDMANGFRTFSEALKAMGANQIVRLVSFAEYLSDDYIQGAHVTHVLHNATPVVPSFVSRLSLRRGTKHWKMVENFGGYAHGSWPVRVLRVDHDAQSSDAPSDNPDARRESAQPLALYQKFLNALTRANVAGDFETYCAMCCFPYTSHTQDEDIIMHTPDDVRPFFDMLQSNLDRRDVEEFARIADHAEFIAGDTICGYHTSRFLSQGQEKMPPIKSRMILRRDGTRWFLQSVTNSIEKTTFPYEMPVTTSSLISQRAIQERTKT